MIQPIDNLNRLIEIQRNYGTNKTLKVAGEWSGVAEFHRNAIRNHLPERSKSAIYNDIPIGKNQRWFDQTVPWKTEGHVPGYKSVNIECVKEAVQKGDHVVVIGGGQGVTATAAAQATGEQGQVTIYEADESRCSVIRRTLELNDIENRCTINRAIVGKPHYLPSDVNTEIIIPPSKLPECDVLEMDCEGAELEILQELSMKPQKLVCETHAEKEYSPYNCICVLTKILHDMGYITEIEDGKRWAENILVGTL